MRDEYRTNVSVSMGNFMRVVALAVMKLIYLINLFCLFNKYQLEVRHNDVKVVLTGDAFDAISVKTVEDCHQDQQCTVCLCNYNTGDQVVCMPKCQHLFHKECAKDWLTKYKRSCPNCRLEIDGATQMIDGPSESLVLQVEL